MHDLKQALRNAIEVEWAASRFYERLAPKAADTQACEFLLWIADEEIRHANALAERSYELCGAEIPEAANFDIEGMETVPQWSCADNVSYAQALQVAQQAEEHTELFYEALAGTATSPAAQAFFREIAESEARHARTIAGLRECEEM